MILEIEHSQAVVIGAWEKTTTALKKMVEKTYPDRMSIIEAADFYVADRLAAERSGLENDLDDVRGEIERLERKIRTGYGGAGAWDDPEGPQRTLAEFKKLERFYQTHLGRNAQRRRVLSNPKYLKKMKNFYKHHLRERIRRLDAVRASLPEKK